MKFESIPQFNEDKKNEEKVPVKKIINIEKFDWNNIDIKKGRKKTKFDQHGQIIEDKE